MKTIVFRVPNFGAGNLSNRGRGPSSLGLFNSMKAGRNRTKMRKAKRRKVAIAEDTSETIFSTKRTRLSSETMIFHLQDDESLPKNSFDFALFLTGVGQRKP